MKITEVRTRVVRWKGSTVPLPANFCTKPMDLISPLVTRQTRGTFTFHDWLIVEVRTNTGLVGIGNAALSPLLTKQCIDQHLTPLLLGQDPWDVEFLWQHMYRKTMAFGRKGVALVAIGLRTVGPGPTTALRGGLKKKNRRWASLRRSCTPISALWS